MNAPKPNPPSPNIYRIGAALILILITCCLNARGQEVADFAKREPAFGTRFTTLPADTIIRVKASQHITSARVKIGDYVQFEVAEDVIEKPGVPEPVVLIRKGTPVFGHVVDHKNRILVFRPGTVAVTIDSVRAVDGSEIKVLIARHQVTLAVGAGRRDADQALALRNTLQAAFADPLDRKWSPNRISTKETLDGRVTCIKGRAYISNFTATLPSAIVAALATTGLVIVKDSTAKAAAAVTLAGQFASQSGLSSIINGSYAEIDAGEIFDAVPDRDYQIVFADKAFLARATPQKGEVRIQHYHNPTPEGFLAIDYFPDLAKHPNAGGEKYVYTGKVIARFANKKIGETMRMCADQIVPVGFDIIDKPKDNAYCPREPGDRGIGPTYYTILRKY